MKDPAPLISETRAQIHRTLRSGLSFAHEAFTVRSTDGIPLVAAAIVTIGAGWTCGLLLALGEPKK